MADRINSNGPAVTRCQACGAANPARSLICYRCGTPLPESGPSSTSPLPSLPQSAAALSQGLRCPKCDKELPPHSRFCGYCGASLAESPDEVTISRSPARPPQPAETAPPPQPLEGDRWSAAGAPPAAVPGVSWSGSAPASGATMSFPGLAGPRVEASITEVKPDGSRGETLAVQREVTIGREGCSLSYPQDSLLSPSHASVLLRDGGLFLRDQGSRHGTFIRLRQDVALAPGHVFLVGQTLFRITVPPGPPAGTVSLEQIRLDGTLVAVFSLEKPETTVGRTRGDLLFRDDPYMSGLHACILKSGGRYILQDLKSRNGVYLRISGEVELKDGDQFFLGEHLFQIRLQRLS